MKGFIYLQDVAHGMLIKQIAQKHRVTVSAVDKSLSKAKRQLKAKTLYEAVYKATKQGLILSLVICSLCENPDMMRVRRAKRRASTKEPSTLVYTAQQTQ
jgi:cytochrome c biogenesis protein ResB